MTRKLLIAIAVVGSLPAWSAPNKPAPYKLTEHEMRIVAEAQRTLLLRTRRPVSQHMQDEAQSAFSDPPKREMKRPVAKGRKA